MSLYIAIAIGFLLSLLLPNQDIRSIPGYEFLLYTLLGIGLYGSVYGIELGEFRKQRQLIVRAITIGVVLKSIITGSVLWLVFRTPYAFLFGIIVAQIDPLSVAHLIEGKTQKFSESARTILRAWSSFDDPMTVLLAFYVYLPLAITGKNGFSPIQYLIQFSGNIAFALVLWIVSKRLTTKNVQSFLLLIAFVIAISFQLMLGLALVGLFLRPRFISLPKLITTAFILAALILGTLIEISWTSISYGVVLGAVAYVAQIVATFFVAPKLHINDKLFLSLAQYNGITSVILALIISQWVAGTASVIAFSVLTINALYYISNNILELRVGKERR